MKTKKNIFIVLFLAAIVAIGFFFLITADQVTEKPSVEVINPQVFADNRELKSGDQLDLKTEVKTTNSGRADINFANGSTARLEPNASLLITDSTLSKETSITKIFLNFGEVISQVKKLATPESTWEVRTANAVAVVRGTKFSVRFDSGTSLIKVFEGSVLVAVIDPITGEIIEGTAVIVSAGQFTEISSDNVELKKKPEALEAFLIYSDNTSRDVTKEVEWEFSDEDRAINAIWKNPETGRELRGQAKIDNQ